MTVFDKAVAFVLAHEAGYVNDPNDPGQATNFGISKRSFPSLDIKGLSRTDAIEIYRQQYWITCKCGYLPAPIAFVLFDSAVNQGPSAAVKCLQRALSVDDDGVLGAQTMAALQHVQPRQLVPELIARRAVLYSQTPNVKTYGLGWFRRLAKCQQVALEPFA